MDIGDYKKYKDMDDFTDNTFLNEAIYKYPIQFGILIFILIPLCLIKNIGKLGFVSFLGVGSLLIMYFVVFIESPWYISDYWQNVYKEDNKATYLNIFDIWIGFDKELNFMRGTALLFYGFGTHFSAYPIMKSLKNRTYVRLQKVFFRGTLVCGILYMAMGAIGYLSVPYKTPDLIVERYQIFHPDIFMSIGRGLYITTLIFKIPANYNSLRTGL